MAALIDIVPTPGVLIARDVCRHLRALGFTAITEFVPARGLRVDVIALGPKGEIWIIECKSSRVDFTSDHKWNGYLEWSDRFFFAVGPDFPVKILPDDAGVILADAYDAEIARLPEATPLAGARRTSLTRSFARAAATRLSRFNDPDAPV